MKKNKVPSGGFFDSHCISVHVRYMKKDTVEDLNGGRDKKPS